MSLSSSWLSTTTSMFGYWVIFGTTAFMRLARPMKSFTFCILRHMAIHCPSTCSWVNSISVAVSVWAAWAFGSSFNWSIGLYVRRLASSVFFRLAKLMPMPLSFTWLIFFFAGAAFGAAFGAAVAAATVAASPSGDEAVLPLSCPAPAP